ncbi:27943_t:CDS:1, partial [Gigaspora margarita]
ETFLAVGNTGLGKSFTARLFGFPAEVGSSVNSMTEDVKIYSNKKYKFIDTPGFDDSNVKVDDENTKLNILFEMQKDNVTFVNTIFWFVKNDIRSNGSIKKQAKFINDLAMNSKSNVWGNTIIIFKGYEDQLNKDPIKEAIRVANDNISPLAEPSILPVYLYEELHPHSPYRDLSDEKLRYFGIYKNNDSIKNKYKEIMRANRHADHPVQIIFNDVTCIKCGKKIDKRLSGRFPCHTNEKFEHGNTEIYNYNTIYTHTGRLVTVQDPGWEKAGRIVKSVPLFGLLGSIVTDIGQAATERTEWSCCQRAYGSTGCKEEHSTRVRYTCCHKDVHTNPPACKKVCASCGKTWGNTEGCTNHSQHDFVENL